MFWSISLVDRTWKSHPAMSAALFHHSAVWTGASTSKFLIYGGTADGIKPLGKLYQYDPANGASVDMSMNLTYVNSPKPRFGHSAVYLEDAQMMFVFGGKGAEWYEIYNDLWTFRPTENQWRLVQQHPSSPRPTVRFLHAAAGDGHRMFIWGGQQRYRRSLSRLWTFSPQSQTWAMVKEKYRVPSTDEDGIISVAQLNYPKPMYAAAGGVRGNFYLFGGMVGPVHLDRCSFMRISADADPDVRYSWTDLLVPPEDFTGSTIQVMESFGAGYDTVITMFGGDVSRLEYYWSPYWNYVDGEDVLDFELKTRWVRGPTNFLYIYSIKEAVWTFVGGEFGLSWWFQPIPSKPVIPKKEGAKHFTSSLLALTNPMNRLGAKLLSAAKEKLSDSVTAATTVQPAAAKHFPKLIRGFGPQ
eukprot:c16181_g1_i1.p1 GENE.c16181_g1_i1~~c16181_g1_i1.p1  ORF type:complete len:413 (-),score=87.95 c16181_g1_i1:81-1319(-)